MMRARRSYFRSHRNPTARRAFVRRQRAKLGKLRRAAACRVVPAGARIVARISIPDAGPATVGANAVWVVDRASRSLFRVDATTDAITDQIEGVTADKAAFGFDSVWLPAFDLNTVYRVDSATRQVSRLPSGPDASQDEGPLGAATSATAVWVTNHHGGTVAQLDPVTGAFVRSVQLVSRGANGPGHVVADGGELWVGLPGYDAVARVDIATATVAQRISVPGGACGALAAAPAQIWIAGARCGSHRLAAVSAIDRLTGRVAEFPIAATPLAVAVAFGSVWVTTISPPQLLRIDPATGTVVGILGLPAPPGPGGAGGIAVASDALWVRAMGSLLRVVPED